MIEGNYPVSGCCPPERLVEIHVSSRAGRSGRLSLTGSRNLVPAERPGLQGGECHFESCLLRSHSDRDFRGSELRP